MISAMQTLFTWMINSDSGLTLSRKKGGQFVIHRAGDSHCLIIQAENPSAKESQAILAAQKELDQNSSADGFCRALRILEPHTHGIFVLSTLKQF